MSFNKVSDADSLLIKTTAAYQGLNHSNKTNNNNKENNNNNNNNDNNSNLGFVTEAHSLPKNQTMCRSVHSTGMTGFLKEIGGSPVTPNGLLLNDKVALKHWWESPLGKGSQGRAVTSTFPLHHQPPAHSGSEAESPAKSDVTFGDGCIWNQNSDTEYTPADSSAYCPRGHPTERERVQVFPIDLTPDTALSSRVDTSHSPEHMLTPESGGESYQEGFEKEKENKWSEEEGKMTRGANMFNAVLPSADEVGLQWRISELRAALRASESARLETERETEAFRKYLSEVEAAAAGLQSRVHGLEHLISFSSKDETRELDQLRAKLASEASKEARNQAVAAAQSVAAAREATMELDRVKRHASALIKAQEEEIERLSMEAAECRTLYNARSAQLQAMKEQIDKLEQKLKQQSKASEEALQASQQDILNLQMRIESAKMEAEEKVNKFNELQETLDYTKSIAQAAERQLGESEREKKELTSHNEWLEHRAAELQNQEVTAAHYDHEIRKVKAVLGGEKQHLLAELAMLRRGNQTLQGEVVEWQEKFHALSRHVSGLESISSANKHPISISDSKLNAGNDQPSCTFEIKSSSESQHSEQDQGKVFLKPGSAARESPKESNAHPDRKVGDGQFVTPILMKSSHGIQYRVSQSNSAPEVHDALLDGKWGMNGPECRVPVTTPDGVKSVNSHVPSKMSSITECGSCQKTSCVLLRENLLAAAHREIVKLKEINQCLVAACQTETKPTKELRSDLAMDGGRIDFSSS